MSLVVCLCPFVPAVNWQLVQGGTAPSPQDTVISPQLILSVTVFSLGKSDIIKLLILMVNKGIEK